MRVGSEVGVFLGFHGCKGLQPSRPGMTIAALIFDLDLEGVRSLGATLDDASFLRSE
jgi:hypothetical protein